MPDKLEKQIPLFDDDEVGLVYSDVMNFNSDGYECRVYHRLAYYKGNCFHELLKCYFLCMPSVVIRAAALKREEEWFDARFELISELDLFTRIAYSWKLDMCPDVLARYRVHASSATWVKEDLGFREKLILLDKYCKLWPEFSRMYSEMMKIQTYYVRAKYLWKMKRANEGRRCLMPYVLKNFRSLLLCFASFFPYEFVLGIYDRKTVKPIVEPLQR